MSDLIEVFSDTRRRYASDATLRAACEYSRHNQEFVGAGDKISCNLSRFDEAALVTVSKSRSFEAAERYAGRAGGGIKTAVLNFANSYHPGGGVAHGARAQEEYLCRISTLYDALCAPEMQKSFYEPHCRSEDDLATDDIIYTPRVLVFKTDTGSPVLRPESEWFYTDVITCAAPCLGLSIKSVPAARLRELHESRARHILDTACSHGVDAVILGAFGCGAFQNPPDLVAQVYAKVLPSYAHAFKAVEFAIYCREYETKNYAAFKAVFDALQD